MRYRPWSLDFTPDDAGTSAYPHEFVVNPYRDEKPLEWSVGDWDPALRFWTLEYDPQLTEWQQSVDPSRPSTLAAREFGARPSSWLRERDELVSDGWLEQDGDLRWLPDPGAKDQKAAKEAAWSSIRAEIDQLQQLMQDDRERYLAELDVQADGLADYFVAFIGANQQRQPWTIELISCALAIGNVAYMAYKNKFKRVRPSFLCPGLVPPFGPPGHPSFPSGHSFLGHLIALLLLEIPELQRRYGLFTSKDGAPGQAVPPVRSARTDPLAGTGEIPSPLLWLAQRVAKNRERLGVHYASDSSASRHLAAGIWRAWRAGRISCPTLDSVLQRAAAEWRDPAWEARLRIADDA